MVGGTEEGGVVGEMRGVVILERLLKPLPGPGRVPFELGEEDDLEEWLANRGA